MQKRKQIDEKDAALTAFNKARSLLDTIIRMTQDGRYCVDIMQQNLAVIGLLKSAQEKLMNNHLSTCFLKGVTSGNKSKQHEMIGEIESVMRMGNK